MTRSCLRRWVLLGSLTALAAACEPEAELYPEPQSPSCTRSTHDIAVTETTTLGVSARELLDRHEGTTTGPLQWNTAGSDYSLVLVPSAEPVELTLSLAYEGGAVRFIEQQVVAPEGWVNEVSVVCPDLLEIEAVLELTTADGALDETLATVVAVTREDDRADGALLVEAAVDTALSRLDGALAVEGIEPETWQPTDGLRVFVQLTDEGSTGRLQTGVVNPDGQAVAIDLAQWQTTAP